VISLAFLWTYKRHVDYRFPYHQDEWQHIGISQQIMAEGYNRQFNPFLGVPADHADLEPGFHAFLAVLFQLIGTDMILSYQYLAGIFASVAVLAIFMCILQFSRSFAIAILACLAFIGLSTNVNILGKEFFVPMSMAFSMIFFYIYLLKKAIDESDRVIFYLALVAFCILLLTHPPSAIILIIPSMIEILTSKGLLKKESMYLVIPFALLAFLLLWKGNITESGRYLLDIIYFEQGWGRLEVNYFLPFLYGLAPTLLALYGMFIYFEKYRFFSIFAFLSLAITSFFNLLGYTFLVPYSRALHLSMLSLLIFTAAGFEKITEKIGTLKPVLLAAVILIMFIPTYSKDREFRDYAQMTLTEDDYEALLWIRNNLGTENRIVTPYFMTSSVYPVSGNRVISLIPAQMEGGPIDDNLNFYVYNCDRQRQIIGSTGANLLYSRSSISCAGYEKVNPSGNYFIYRV
jgi:hypothetical protein